MRLLNTKSHTFKEFFDSGIPEYAILSHRWGDEEITFQEFRKGKNQDSQGYAKVRRCCLLAETRGLAWIWVDTCCIDKKSSAELSEAINSMYRWYENAQECYVYLSDVAWNHQNIASSKADFTQSSWFTRGWTLQEVLAPKSVIFFDSAWNDFGTKKTLSTLISAVTGISFDHMGSPLRACVATKMSWVSRRITSRLEDMAYCMLGLFDVNMPLLYGEGAKAFIRLQLEIIKQSDDESIFAWTLPENIKHDFGLLAPWPTCFAESGDVQLHPFLKMKRSPYQMTNQGLQFEVRFWEGSQGWSVGATELALNCWRKNKEGRALAVTVSLTSRTSGEIWQRQGCDKLGLSASVDESFSGSEHQAQLIKIHQPTSSQAVLEGIGIPATDTL